MSRKFNKTEVSGNVNVKSNGQHMRANWFCVNCHCIGSHEKHYPDCNKKESYAIPSTGEVPKKDAIKNSLFTQSQLGGGGILTIVGGLKMVNP
jgi:hypothetical protein